MLGFDYLGQTALATLPYAKIILDITEDLVVTDTVKTKIKYLLNLFEKVSFSDSVKEDVAALLKISEKYVTSDQVRSFIIIKALESVILIDKIKVSFAVIFKEIARIIDRTSSVIPISVRELFTINDLVHFLVSLKSITEKAIVHVRESYIWGIIVKELSIWSDYLAYQTGIIVQEILKITDKIKLSFSLATIHEQALIKDKSSLRFSVIVHELAKIADSFILKSLALVIREQAILQDKTRLKLWQKISERVLVSETLVELLTVLIVSQAVFVAEQTRILFTVLVEEVVNFIESILVDGKTIIKLWEACYSKGVAEVKNLYKKFRGRGGN